MDYHDDTQLNIHIDLVQLYTFDVIKSLYSKTDVNTSQIQNKPFLCIMFQDLKFKSCKKTINFDAKYHLNIKSGAVMDMCCIDPKWKYFVKLSKNNAIDIQTHIHHDKYIVSVIVSPFNLNIREETLLRLLALFDSKYQLPASKPSTQVHFKYVNISGVDISLSYQPLLLKNVSFVQNGLSIKDFKIQLNPIIINDVNSINLLIKLVKDKWNSDINPSNIVQFIPNLKILKPYTSPIYQLLEITSRYFRNPSTRSRIRSITNSVSNGADFTSSLLKAGVNQIYELFI